MSETEVQLFEGDDQAYRDWLGQHPDGFVANRARTGQLEYFVVHRAKCRFIRRDFGPGAVTEHKYVKVAGVSNDAVQGWGVKKGYTPTLCGACKPPPVPVPAEDPAAGLHPGEEPEDAAIGWEGAVVHITVNAYERDPALRQKCIDALGSACMACGLDMNARYHGIKTGFIHVHHLQPLSAMKGKKTKVNAETDLVPLCPNCHAVAHLFDPPLTLQDIKDKLLPTG